jgi:hypothetical protein
MEYGIIGLLILVLDIIAIVSVIKSGMEPVMKLLWVLLILVLPVVGMILYFVLNKSALRSI